MTVLSKLRQYRLTVFRDKTAQDDRQVPADATLDFYLQGATVSDTAVIGPTEIIISVYDSGRLSYPQKLWMT
jgi:hypothetical protein